MFKLTSEIGFGDDGITKLAARLVGLGVGVAGVVPAHPALPTGLLSNHTLHCYS